MSKETKKEEKIAIEEISNIAEEVKKICDQISKYDRNTINRILIAALATNGLIVTDVTTLGLTVTEVTTLS